MSVRTEVEDFILKEFFEGKSVDKLVRDFQKAHPEYTPQGAQKKIYRVLCEFANSY